jgi:hypothetical protein
VKKKEDLAFRIVFSKREIFDDFDRGGTGFDDVYRNGLTAQVEW